MRDMALTLRDVHASVNASPVLNGISMDIRRGCCTVIMGPNGAGKSMLMKLAHGLFAPSRGAVEWAHTGNGSIAKHAMVAQRPLMMRRSAHANIVHALALDGCKYAARHAQAHAVLEKFRLSHLAARPATRLSGGEQQRLAIARAAAVSPDVIFLDEPTAALDPAATREVEASIRQLRDDGVTVIMSTHSLPQARRLADDILLMHKGQVVEAGAAADFFNTPHTANGRAFLAGDLLL